MEYKSNMGLLTRNKVGAIAEEDNLQLHDYLEPVKAFARLTYESVYVIDYARMAFEYVSDNPLFLCGYSSEEVLRMGYDFYFKNVPEDDLELLHVINEAGFAFFEKIPDAERKLYSITYDFHLIHGNNKSILVNHRLTPLFLTKEGNMWKAMCLVSVSHHQDAGNITIQKQGSDEIWKFDIAKKLWSGLSKPRLTEREIEVLRLYAQGLTINQIAEKIFVVPDTVKYYRRRIFQHFDVRNIVEALSYAKNNKII